MCTDLELVHTRCQVTNYFCMKSLPGLRKIRVWNIFYTCLNLIQENRIFFLIWGFVLLLSRALRDGRNLNDIFFLLLQMKLMNRRHHDGLRLRLCFSSVCYFIFRYFAFAVKSTYTNTLLHFLTNAETETDGM